MLPRTAPRCALLAVLLLLPMIADAKPTKEEMAPLQDKLGKRIDVDFKEEPLEKALAKIAEAAELNIVFEAQDFGTNIIDLKLKAVPALEILDIVLRKATPSGSAEDLDWTMRRELVVVGVASELDKASVVLRRYDIAGLLTVFEDIKVPGLGLANVLADSDMRNLFPEWVTEDRGNWCANGRRPDPTRSEGPTHEEVVKEIQDQNVENVGRPVEWAVNGGDVSSMSERRGQLQVKTTPANHQRIKELLAELAQERSPQIRYESRLMLVKSGPLADLLAKQGGDMVLDAKQAEAFLAGLMAAEAKTLHLARVSGHVGQRVGAFAGEESFIIVDQRPTPNGVVLSPTLATLRAGAAFAVRGSTASRGALRLALCNDLSAALIGRAALVPTGLMTAAGTVDATVELKAKATPKTQAAVTPAPAKDAGGPKPATPTLIDHAAEGELKLKGTTTQPGPARVTGMAALDLPSQRFVRLSTSAVIPDGGAVVLTATPPAGLGAEGMELVLVVRATLVGAK